MTKFAKLFSALGITGISEPSQESLRLDIDNREVMLLNLLLSNAKVPGAFVPEILTTASTDEQLAGPFFQIEGHGGDASIDAMTEDGSSTAWANKTIYDGKPIEGVFRNISLNSGELVAYKKRA